ncbi:MAG: SH3 domain-containing protein [Chloroflexi bacterium]|nr:SH3 domain-containing protein [Chloroflexota bacterium]MCC6895411.1 SH3 domain-containing protein [Anaerolineae bacterium]
MSNKRKYMVTMAAAFGMAIAAAAPAMAQDNPTPEPTAEVTPVPPPLTASTELFVTSNYLVNVRSGPGRSFAVLGQVRPGDALDVTGRGSDGAWVQVNFNGQSGWVSANLFDATGDLTTASVVEVAADAPTAESTSEPLVLEPGTLIGNTTVNVNLRVGPSTSTDKIVVIPFSTDLVVKGRTSTNNWYWVTYNDQSGWITAAAFFVEQGNIVDVPVVDEAGNVVPDDAPAPTAEATAAQ